MVWSDPSSGSLSFRGGRSPRPPTQREQLTPHQRARMRAAARAIKDGKVDIPLVCAHCDSRSLVTEQSLEYRGPGEPFGVESSQAVLVCITCGRKTYLSTAHAERKRRIMAFIREGIDYT